MDSSKAKRDFKKGLSADDSRRRREETSIKLRKEKKEEGLAKRRNLTVSSANPEEDMLPPTGAEGQIAGGSVNELRQFASLLTSAEIAERVKGMVGIRKLLSLERNPPVAQCVELGIVPYLVDALSQPSTDLQLEAAWALTNIASTEYTKLVVESGAVPPLAQLLNSASPAVREQSAWCLGNVAGDCAQLRDYVLAQNALPLLLANVAQPANVSLLRNCVWALSNFCRGKPQPALATIAPALPLLRAVIANYNDVDATIDAVWALSYISDGDDARIQAVVDQDVLPQLVSLMASNKKTCITPALRTIGNIATGNDKQTQAVVDAGVVPVLAHLLRNPNKSIRKEACWLMSNIAAGSVEQMQKIFEVPDLLPAVLEVSTSDDWDVRKEAAWVVSNIATTGQVRHIMLLVEKGGLKPICELLTVGDPKIIIIALDALESILSTAQRVQDKMQILDKYIDIINDCDGIDKLENLQEHENHKVYEKAVRILERYFNAEDENESQNIVPSSAGGQFTFGVATTGKSAVDFNDAFIRQQATQGFHF